jgi:hypothetical protein
MISGRTLSLTAIAKVFNLIGHMYVTLPARIAVAGFLAARRRWWHLTAFTTAMVLSEVLIGLLKGAYGRPRPPGRSWQRAVHRSRQDTPSPRRSRSSRQSSPSSRRAGARRGRWPP